MSVAIKTVNLNKTYKLGKLDIEVLKDVNIEIKEGEFTSVMGPSGSGKSTLLYLIGALDKPTSGSIVIGGQEISKMPDSRQSIMRRRELGISVLQPYTKFKCRGKHHASHYA